ncbi:microcin ABC transporter ATP-binding protein (plasmid) [Azospirillum argentinense]|uniref:ABC transporter ATP-binding protein n=1 Tax=Azospirillum argentinense TaxID=2970906 RepID=A0A2K1G467_9PROT|nr:ABC transporter ATP-binding protein [Azospirillum argentinense]AIB14909.1 microcin ABC transporter ATP-binding protein [Azospirillum argentinense]EZQ04408.1 ABC transporter ATP-binding protein [Azospirillum argentinense]KAA1057412.1 ABC transporter, ATP-binding protein (cluster 5, nickel/peptides/opines) / ABC transporter, ATP-binding protein (cluster 5, nickel/peptides/opines) [Azospirillum argentinense]MBK3798331.1 dipeptide ABC transporter ATP-binding protein [Azospirillum argentinense]P
MTETPLLDVRNLTIDLPRGADRPHAVQDLTFTLEPGEILCVVGESGSGKSMTAHAVLGLLPKAVKVSSGEIRHQGTNVFSLPERDQRSLRGGRIAMIFQEPMTALNPLMRVGDQIDEVLRYHTTLDRAARRARVVELLASVGLPEPDHLRRSYPFRLSGGQRQRVMIAMALAVEPDILIADEPTTALDVTTQKQILELIQDIQAKRRMGVMFITHDFGVVAEIAHRVAVMQRGQIVEIGTAEEVLNHPRHPYTRQLIAAVPHLIEHREDFTRARQPVLTAEKVCKTFHLGGGFFTPGRKVVAGDDLSLTIHQGETVGLVGESGSGKSTLGRSIVGLIKPDSGRILFEGVDLLSLSRPAFRPYRRHVQMVFQDPYASLNPRHTVGDIITQGPVAFGEDRHKALEKAKALLKLVGLDASAAERFPHEFSGGQRQRISIARALALEPKLLIADEPVSALDVSVQAQVLDLLEDLRHRLNLSMLFITHDLRIAAQICDTIAVMQKGRIVEIGPAKEVFGNPQHSYTRTLLDAIPGKGWTIPEDVVPVTRRSAALRTSA